jgi:hypothetical protein
MDIPNHIESVCLLRKKKRQAGGWRGLGLSVFRGFSPPHALSFAPGTSPRPVPPSKRATKTRKQVSTSQQKTAAGGKKETGRHPSAFTSEEDDHEVSGPLSFSLSLSACVCRSADARESMASGAFPGDASARREGDDGLSCVNWVLICHSSCFSFRGGVDVFRHSRGVNPTYTLVAAHAQD